MLRITTTPAKLNIQTTNAKLEITNPKFPYGELEIEHPKIEMRTKLPKVNIDQYQCFAEAGRMGNLDLSRDNSSYSKSQMMQSIGKIVEQGNQMADFHQGDPIPDQANYNAYEQFVRDWNIDTIPKSRPTITLDPGNVDIQLQRGSVRMNSKQQKPSYNYSPGKVDIYLAQKNSIEINFIDEKV